MYTDHSPEPRLTIRVVVLEGDESADDVIKFSWEEGIASPDIDGDDIFWIVFANEPKRVWDFTEESLRSSLRKQAS